MKEKGRQAAINRTTKFTELHFGPSLLLTSPTSCSPTTMSAPPSLSFRIQAPLRPSSTPPSRPTSRPAPNDEGDSSDDDLPSNRNRDELVTGFDARGLTKYVLTLSSLARANESRRKTKDVVTAPLLIPSLPNLDWRSAASSKNGGGRKKKREMYVPDNGGRSMAMSGGKKAVGEREVINSTVVVGGLELGVKKEVTVVQEEEMEVVEEKVEVEVVRETEEQRALRELMTGAQAPTEAPPELDIIMPAAAGDVRGPPLEEGDAFKRDLMSRPDEVSSLPSLRRNLIDHLACSQHWKTTHESPLVNSDSHC